MKRTPLFIIFLIVFIDLLGFGIVIPILPAYAVKGLGASDLTVGVIIASYSLMMFLFTPVWGRWSDRVGRKPVLLIGLAASVVAYIMFAVTDSLFLLIASRLLAGIGGANISAAQAYIADVTPPDQRAKGMGLIGAAFGLGFVFGPFIGGTLSAYGYHVPGFLAAGLSALSLVTTFLLLPEPEKKPDRTGVEGAFNFISLRDFRYMINHPNVGKLLVLNFLVVLAVSVIYAILALYGLKHFLFSDREVGYLFGAIGLTGAVTQGGLIRHLVARVDERVLFLGGNIIMTAGLFLTAFVNSTAMLYLSTVLYSIGTGTNNPTSLSLLSRCTSPKDQGTVLGMNQSVTSLSRVFGPILGGFLFQHVDHHAPFFASAAIMVVVSLLSLRLLSKNSFITALLHLD